MFSRATKGEKNRFDYVVDAEKTKVSHHYLISCQFRWHEIHA